MNFMDCWVYIVFVLFSEILTQKVLLNEKDRREYLMGTSAILFVFFDDEEDHAEAETRLKNLVHAIPKIPPGKNLSLWILFY